jgi:hypothetical protein
MMTLKIGQRTTNGMGVVMTSALMPFVQQSVKLMVPWLIVMLSVILTDLIFGIRKSMKLGVHVSISTAVRNTMGKMVTYFSFVVMVCFIDAALSGNSTVAKWSCALVCVVEGVSIIGNMLKPYGMDFSLAELVRTVIKIGARRVTGEEVEDKDLKNVVREQNIANIRDREQRRWGKEK